MKMNDEGQRCLKGVSRSQTGAPRLFALLLALFSATVAHAEVGKGLSSLFNVDTRWGFGTSASVSGFFPVDTRFSGSTGNADSGLFTLDTMGALTGTATIAGYVRDANNAGLAGATVSALQNGVLRLQTATDPSGSYSLMTLPYGAYEVRAAKANYLTANRYGVNAVANQTTSQSFWLAGNPAAPLTVATNRTLEPLATVTITGTQLKKFDGVGFVSTYTLDPSRKTVVFTHGWNSNPDLWAKSMAANMVASGVTDANLLAWDWREVAGTLEPSLALSHVCEQGDRLGLALKIVLQPGYSQPVHFIGHSLGTLVNASAANATHRAGFDWHKTHLTLLDEGEMANEIPLGDMVTGVESLWGRTEAPRLGWVTPEPDEFGWMDNYFSLVGLPHPYSVNVWLGQGIDRADRSGLKNFITSAHGYACAWYGATALNPNSSILGHRYSFERLGSGVNLSTACPYPDASLFAQDIYPSNPYPLHELTGDGVANYVEFNAAVFRALSMTTLYATDAGIKDVVHAGATGAMIGINTMSRVGQTIGNAYLDVIEATGSVVADASIWTYQTASSLGSQFFHSLRAVLHSGTGGPSQSGNGIHPLGPGVPPPGVWLPIQVPTNAVVMAFDFTFTGDAGSDVVSASINSTNVFALAATYIPTNQTMHSGSIDVRRWAGQNVELFFGLLGGTTTNATLTVEAMRFYMPAAPTLAAQTSGNSLVLNWPPSATAYVLETSTNLSVGNSWSVVTNVPAIVGFQNTVTNDISAGNHFYRLRK